MTTRATSAEFEQWKAECLADPSKLDRCLPKSVADMWRKRWGIEETVKKSAVVASSTDLAVTIYITPLSTKDQVFEFSVMSQAMRTAGIITDEIFTEMLRGVRLWMDANLMSDDVFATEFKNWIKS